MNKNVDDYFKTENLMVYYLKHKAVFINYKSKLILTFESLRLAGKNVANL